MRYVILFVIFSILTFYLSCSQPANSPDPLITNTDTLIIQEKFYDFLREHGNSVLADSLSIIFSDPTTPDSTRLYNFYRLAKKMYDFSEWRLSDSLFKVTQSLYIQKYGKQHPMVLKLNNWRVLSYTKRDLCDSIYSIIPDIQDLLELQSDKYDPLIVSNAHKSIGLYFNCVGDFEKMKEKYHDAYLTLEKAKDQYPGEAAWALVTLAYPYLYTSEYWTAIEYNNQALPRLMEVYDTVIGEGYTNTVYNNLGYCYNGVGEYDLAIHNLQKAIERNLTFATIENCHDGVAANFKNIAFSNESIGDLQRAKKQFEIALQILKQKEHTDTERAGLVRFGLIRVLYKLNKIEKAQQLALEALKIEERAGRKWDLQTTAKIYTWLGKIYLHQKLLHKATAAFSKAKSIHKNQLLGTKYLFYDFQLEEAQSYFEAHLFQESLDKALELFENISPDFPKKDQLGLLISKSYLYLNKLNKSKQWLDYTSEVSNYDIKNPNRLNKQYLVDFILSYLKTNADLQLTLYNKNQKQKNLNVALFYLEEATSYIFIQRTKLLYTSHIHNLFVPIQEQLIELYERYDVPSKEDKILKQFEMAKAIRLIRNAKTLKSQEYPGVPLTVSKRLNELESKIRFYETEMLKSPETKAKFTAKLEFASKDLAELKTTIRQRHSDFYQYRFEHQPISVAQVQQQLNENQVLLEYFWGDQFVKAILISKETVDIKTLGKTKGIRKSIKALLQGINEAHKKTKKSNIYLKQYINEALSLYDRLIKPFQPLIREKQNQLIIIPDGPINTLPLNALLSSTPEDIRKQYTFDYLIKRFNINMGYSATYQFDIALKQEINPSINYLGFAPFASTSNTVTEHRSTNQRINFVGLPHSSKEVKKGKDTFDGIYYLDTKASKDKFLSEAGKAKILHCATHATGDSINGNLSYLLFSKASNADSSEQVFVSDIYNLHLNAELAILGTCQSAKGEYARGEGMISLAHAFSTAGAKSVCSTLWNLNDEASYRILSKFFELLKEGIPKSQALRLAQMDYINQYPQKANPYYWAVFNMFGDMEKLSF